MDYELLRRFERQNLQFYKNAALPRKSSQALEFARNLCSELSLPSVVLHSGLQLLDRVGQFIDIEDSMVSTMAAVCTFIGSKVEMDAGQIPGVRKFLSAVGNGNLIAEDFRCLEVNVLRVLEWSTLSATHAHFIPSFVRKQPLLDALVGQSRAAGRGSFIDTALLVIAEEVGGARLNSLPSEISSVVFHLMLTEVLPHLDASEIVEEVTGYNVERDLQECRRQLVDRTRVWDLLKSKLPKNISPRSTLNLVHEERN